MRRNIFLTIIALFLIGGSLCAQGKFREIENIDGVVFSYRWKNEKKKQSESPLELKMKLKNTNNYRVEVSFTVDYFYKSLRKASSEPQSFCVKSEKAMVGRIRRSGFDRAGLSNEQLLSDDFILELSAIEVSKSPDCRQGK